MHPTMGNKLIVKEKPPYEVSGTTWGWFQVPVTIYFKPEINKRPLHYAHSLSLTVLRGSESAHEVFW